MTVTLAEQIGEVKRELFLREPAYKKFVQVGKLSQENADKQMARMQAVLATLLQLQAANSQVLNSQVLETDVGENVETTP